MSQKYIPICTRHQIGTIFYPNAKTPANGVTKTFANDETRQLEYEAMDLGTYCVLNGIKGSILCEVDGELLDLLVKIQEHMKERNTIENKISPELLEKFNAFMEFEDIRKQMGKK